MWWLIPLTITVGLYGLWFYLRNDGKGQPDPGGRSADLGVMFFILFTIIIAIVWGLYGLANWLFIS